MKIFRITVGAQTRITCRSAFQQLEILPLSMSDILSLMIFSNDHQEVFEENTPFTILIQGINNNFIDPMPTYLVFKRVLSMLAILEILPSSVKILKNDKAKFAAALRKYRHTIIRNFRLLTMCKNHLKKRFVNDL